MHNGLISPLTKRKPVLSSYQNHAPSFSGPFSLQNVSLSSMTTSSVSADEGEDVASPSPFTLQPWPDLRLTLTGKPLERNTT